MLFPVLIFADKIKIPYATDVSEDIKGEKKIAKARKAAMIRIIISIVLFFSGVISKAHFILSV